MNKSLLRMGLGLGLLVGLSACGLLTRQEVALPPTVVLVASATPARPASTALPAPPSATPTNSPLANQEPVPSPLPTTAPVPPSTNQQPPAAAGPTTEEILIQATIPVRDQRLLAERLKYQGQTIPSVVREEPPNYQLGDVETFWVGDLSGDLPRHFQAQASLTYVTGHAYWWVQDGVEVDQAGLQRSAEVFENQTYPTNRAFFGSEWTPGVDNDPHLYVFLGDVPGVGGYYYSNDEYSTLVNEFSNEHEMFFINAAFLQPGSEFFDGVLAHEFQHMIHWYQDRNEPVWVNEGFSELAFLINGFGNGQQSRAYLANPDLQLNTWVGIAEARSAALAHYGASYLFMVYFFEQFGEEATKAVVAHPANGEAGFEAVLSETSQGLTFDEVFANWVVANTLNDPALGQGQYGYQQISVIPARPERQPEAYPAEWETTVSQYGADYVELTGQGPLTIEFEGSLTSRVIPNAARSGRYQWYSHRGDDLDTTLTRPFDLRGVGAATLSYWTWYDLEEGWDYAYVEVSTDGGQTWTPLTTGHTSTDNPSGNAFGPGYTGQSAEPLDWVQETVDLSAYAGRQIQVRFEVVTDDAVNKPGLAVDDISIPEIGYSYDVENGDGGWIGEGFVRIDNTLRQRFIVQVVEVGPEVKVRRLALDENNRGSYTVEGLGDGVERAILIVSAVAPVTTEVAGYRVGVSLAEPP